MSWISESHRSAETVDRVRGSGCDFTFGKKKKKSWLKQFIHLFLLCLTKHDSCQTFTLLKSFLFISPDIWMENNCIYCGCTFHNLAQQIWQCRDGLLQTLKREIVGVECTFFWSSVSKSKLICRFKSLQNPFPDLLVSSGRMNRRFFAIALMHGLMLTVTKH